MGLVYHMYDTRTGRIEYKHLLYAKINGVEYGEK